VKIKRRNFLRILRLWAAGFTLAFTTLLVACSTHSTQEVTGNDDDQILFVDDDIAIAETANAKIKHKAPVYGAWFGWEPPLFSNKMRAGHCNDIAFWFGNTDLMLLKLAVGHNPGDFLKKCRMHSYALCIQAIQIVRHFPSGRHMPSIMAKL